jgi:aryl-alcohol dehydrogenase-like predicted oxidoreductase
MQKDVIPMCRRLGIGIVAYSPLGRGFLTGQIKSRDDLAGALLACTAGGPHVHQATGAFATVYVKNA